MPISTASTLVPAERRIAPAGTFSGYASLFDREDLGGDVIAPGAFRDSLLRRGAAGIRMLYQHDPAEPIGVWDEIREDARGLFARGRLTLEVARAREVHALMRAGALDGLSIGFRTVTGHRDARTGVRRLTRIDLWEISIVTFPLLPGARIAGVKGEHPQSLLFAIASAADLLRCRASATHARPAKSALRPHRVHPHRSHPPPKENPAC